MPKRHDKSRVRAKPGAGSRSEQRALIRKSMPAACLVPCSFSRSSVVSCAIAVPTRRRSCLWSNSICIRARASTFAM